MIEMHQRAVLTADLPEHNLKAGDVGTVVFIHENGAAYELEMFTLSGKTIDVVTVEGYQVRPVEADDMLHARPRRA